MRRGCCISGTIAGHTVAVSLVFTYITICGVRYSWCCILIITIICSISRIGISAVVDIADCDIAIVFLYISTNTFIAVISTVTGVAYR